MRAIKYLFLVLLLVSFVQIISSEEEWSIWQPEETSPHSDIIIKHLVNNEGLRRIWLVSQANPSEQYLLFEHERDATVLFSPDQSFLAINNCWVSNEANVLLFKKVEGLQYREVKEANVSDKAWSLFCKVNKLKETGFDHLYVNAIAWSSDSKNLLLSLDGHSGKANYYADSWFCVFNMESLKPSLEFKDMNRGAVHIEK